MNLTKEQIHQQQAAVYGLPQQTIDVSNMTHEQIEGMRRRKTLARSRPPRHRNGESTERLSPNSR